MNFLNPSRGHLFDPEHISDELAETARLYTTAEMLDAAILLQEVGGVFSRIASDFAKATLPMTDLPII